MIEQFEQACLIPTHHFGEDVETAHADDEVGDRRKRSQSVGQRLDTIVRPESPSFDIALANGDAMAMSAFAPSE